MDFDQKVREEARRVANTNDSDARTTNTHLLSMMLWHRSRLLEQMLLENLGAKDHVAVTSGPFKGLKMQLPVHAGAPLPMILGLYESELHPFIEGAIARAYAHVVNIGCGDGYYLTGMARRMPQSKFFGYDINPKAREGATQSAALNDVSGRVTISGEFRGEDFSAHPANNTLVICDIEGGEDDLLDPAKYPGLKGHDVVVELHEVYRPGISERLRQRFGATHDIIFFDHQPKQAKVPQLQGLSEMDEFLLHYEGRGGPTPWFVMTVK